MTKLQIFSDLHSDWRAPRKIKIADGVEIVVVPGDVAEGARNAFAVLRDIIPARILTVFALGNHEFYKRFYLEELALARSAASEFNIVLLENDVAYLPASDGGDQIRFIGATGWTDYLLFGEQKRLAAMAVAREQLNDHRRIGWKRLPWERFRPQEAAALHSRSRQFIAESIAIPHAGPTVVVTNHAPSLMSVPDRWKSDLLSAAYASTIGRDLLEASTGPRAVSSHRDPGTPRVDFWFHGHVHARADYMIRSMRVIANPNGYGDEVSDFDPELVVEI
jgi:hypothetical protein